MKTIYLLRHAKAERRDEVKPDKERKLVKSGIQDSRTIAKSLRQAGIVPELVISSDAPRAFETAETVIKKLAFEGPDIAINPKIYSAEDAKPLMRIIKKMENKYNSVMICGHDPSLSDLACLLVKSFSFELPKSSVLGIECNKRKWTDIVPGTNRIKLFIAPMKAKKEEKLKKQLTALWDKKLETLISNALHQSDAIVAESNRKNIKKRSRQIISEFMNARKNLTLNTLEEISLFFDRSLDKTAEKENTHQKSV